MGINEKIVSDKLIAKKPKETFMSSGYFNIRNAKTRTIILTSKDAT